MITPPPGGAEQTVTGPVRTWGLATGGTAPGASVGVPSKWHQVVRVFYIGCLHTVHFMLHLGPYKYVGCGFAIYNHTKDGDMLVHDKMNPGMCMAFCLKKELKYGSINGATG